MAEPKAAISTTSKLAAIKALEQPLEVALLRALSTTQQREQARPLFDRLLERDLPTDTLGELAHLAAILGFADQASAAARRALQREDLSNSRRVELAGDLARWGDSYLAKTTLEEILISDPADMKALVKLITLLESMWRLHEARAIGEFFLEQRHRSGRPIPALRSALAHVELTAKRPASAQNVILGGEGNAPATCPETWLKILLHLGKTADVTLPPTGPEGVAPNLSPLTQAEVLLNIQRRDEAIELLRAYLNHQPEDIRARAQLRLLTTTEDRANICTNTDNIDELLQLGGLMKQENIPEGAGFCFAKLAKIAPDILVEKIELAETLANKKQFPESRAIYDQLLQHHPTNRRIALGRARALSWSQNYEQAITAYPHLLAIDPTDRIVIVEAARVAIWDKDLDTANTLYSKVIWPDVDQSLRKLLDESNLPQIIHEMEDNKGQEGSRPGRLFRELDQVLHSIATTNQVRLTKQGADTLTSILALLRGRYRVQSAAWLEMKAQRAFYDGRLLLAKTLYCELTNLEPWNQEAISGAAQFACSLGD